MYSIVTGGILTKEPFDNLTVLYAMAITLLEI
jgi:hypothetical protein